MSRRLGRMAEPAALPLLLLVFEFDREGRTAVDLTQLGLLDLSGGISRHRSKDVLARALVAGQLLAELLELGLGLLLPRLELHHRQAYLAQALVGHADDRHVLDGVVSAQEVLDLHRVDVLATGDDDVLLAVDQPDEAVLVHLGHVAREQPAVLEDLGRGLGSRPSRRRP